MPSRGKVSLTLNWNAVPDLDISPESGHHMVLLFMYKWPSSPPSGSLISGLFNGYLCLIEQGLALKQYLLEKYSIC